MDYTAIKSLALNYSDRQDTEVSGNIDNFLSMAEAKINRFFMTRGMHVRAYTPLIEDTFNYSLPNLFLAEESVKLTQLTTTPNRSVIVERSTAEEIAISQNYNLATPIYNIVGNVITVWPVDTKYVLEINYYKRIPALTSSNPTNWLADLHPDCYVFGLMVEINSFVKDADATNLWNQRFMDVLDAISSLDDLSKYKGTMIKTRIG